MRGAPGTPGAVVQMMCENDCGRTAQLFLSNGHGGHRFLCGSCHYLATHPDADERSATRQHRPRSLPVQAERLF